MIKQALLLGVLCSAGLAMAQDITGKWRTIDDETKKPKSIVQISKTGDSYTGRIISVEAGTDANCNNCTGSHKDKALVGTTVVRGLKADGTNKYSGGSIFNPKDGKTYKSNAELTNGGNTLKVRGYVGVSALGRTQTWQRVQ